MNQPMHTYSYSVLRFTPDIRTGEFVNVGIAAFSPSNQLALIRCRDSIARITKLKNPYAERRGLIPPRGAQYA